MPRFAKEFTWHPLDSTVRCSCGERYEDRPGIVSQCPICGDTVCSGCSTICPNCLRSRICNAHMIEKMPITPTHNDDVCVDCARQILEDALDTVRAAIAKAPGRS